MASALLIVVTLLLTVISGWTVRSVANGSPDDITPVRDSLAFQRTSLDHGSGEAAQELFPEGYFFSHVLFGLAWTDLASGTSDGPGRPDVVSARAEARWALDRIASPEGTRPFAARLEPTYGIFYAGWTLLLRAQSAALADDQLPAGERDRIASEADAIAAAFTTNLDTGRSPFLEAYPGQSWPVDSVVAIAALRRADQVTGADHGPLIRRWIDRSGELLDPATGLFPHMTDNATGAAMEGSRGTSQSIIQRLWPTVDPAGAPEVYARFRSHFVSSTLGFVGVREYPEGVEGQGDVDSGPLVLGFSASSTAVSIGAARANGDPGLAVSMLHEADVFGVPLTIGGERRYAFGAVPIGDAFVTWARATPPAPPTDRPAVTAWWPAYLVIPWLIVLTPWLLIATRRRRSTNQRASAPA